jgi:UDP-glucose 6-dehydrogenase
MRVSVRVGWCLGLVTDACVAGARQQGVVWDAEPVRTDALPAGLAPLAEAGLDDLLAGSMAHGNLHAATDLAHAVADAELVWSIQDTSAHEPSSQLRQCSERIYDDIIQRPNYIIELAEGFAVEPLRSCDPVYGSAAELTAPRAPS